HRQVEDEGREQADERGAGREARVALEERQQQARRGGGQQGQRGGEVSPVDLEDGREGHRAPPRASPSAGESVPASCTTATCDCASMRSSCAAGARPSQSTPATNGTST